MACNKGTTMRRLEVFLKRILPAIALMVAFSAPALAGNYTALSDKELKNSKTQDESPKKQAQRVCTKNDKKNINAYAEKLEKFSEEVSTGALKAGEMGENEVLRKDYMKIHENFTEYLKSEKHEQVKQSYKACNVEMPQWNLIESFWTP